jgi:hypothetical protein
MNPNLAAALAFALEVGAVDTSHVRSEALRDIEAEGEPTSATLELLEPACRADMISMLHSLSTESVRGETSKIALGLLKDAVQSSRLSERQVTRAVARMAREGYLPYPEAEGVMHFFEEDLSLVDAGALSSEFRAKIIEELHEFLTRHAA